MGIKMKHKIFFTKLGILLVVILGQMWLTNFKVFNSGNIKLLLVMASNISILSWIAMKDRALKLTRVVAYQTVLVTTMSVVMLATVDTRDGDLAYGQSVVAPLLMGLGLYLMFHMVYFQFKRQDQGQGQDQVDLDKVYNRLSLTPRERVLSDLILKSYTNKDIAKVLFIAESTVKKHIQNIFKKADVKNKEMFREMIDKEV